MLGRHTFFQHLSQNFSFKLVLLPPPHSWHNCTRSQDGVAFLEDISSDKANQCARTCTLFRSRCVLAPCMSLSFCGTLHWACIHSFSRLSVISMDTSYNFLSFCSYTYKYVRFVFDFLDIISSKRGYICNYTYLCEPLGKNLASRCIWDLGRMHTFCHSISCSYTYKLFSVCRCSHRHAIGPRTSLCCSHLWEHILLPSKYTCVGPTGQSGMHLSFSGRLSPGYSGTETHSIRSS